MDSQELSEWMAYYSLQNSAVAETPKQENQQNNLSVDDEISLMKESLS